MAVFDTITEAKLDSMVANDQAYDSHQAEGILLDNNKSFAGRNAGDTASRNLIKQNADDDVEIGDTGNSSSHIKAVQGSYQDIVTASDGATVTFDLADGNVQQVTLGGNRTLALSNVAVGQRFVIRLIQDGTGSRTVTWFTTIKWVGGSAPTLTTTASKIDVFGFICTSAGNYEGYIIGQNI